MNKVFLSGNLTRDPELRRTPNDLAYAKMGIAVNRQYSKNSEGQPQVDFFNLTAWGKTAEFCERYLQKGRRVLVEGRVQTDNYEDKNGVKHYSVNIMVDNIEFADSKRSNNDEGGGGYNTRTNDDGGGDTDDVDVPF